MYTSNGLQQFYADNRFKDLNGSGYSIAVLDAGFDIDHPGFGTDLNKDGGGDQIIRVDLDFTTRKNGITDGNFSHGTAVLGIIDNICPNVKFLPIQVTTTGGMTEALKWVYSNATTYNIVAVSISMGDGNNTLDESASKDVPGIPDFYSELEKQINLLATINIPYSAAAGNFYAAYKAEGVSGLAAFKPAFTISNVNSTGLKQGTALSPSSQRRPDTIGAPGRGLLTYRANGTTVLFAGTSASTPFFSGCVVLLQNVADKYLKRRLSTTELDTLILDNSDPIGDSGYRQINVFKTAEAIYNMIPVAA
jgi:type VI secretion system secreted protein VgrG